MIVIDCLHAPLHVSGWDSQPNLVCSTLPNRKQNHNSNELLSNCHCCNKNEIMTANLNLWRTSWKAGLGNNAKKKYIEIKIEASHDEYCDQIRLRHQHAAHQFSDVTTLADSLYNPNSLPCFVTFIILNYSKKFPYRFTGNTTRNLLFFSYCGRWLYGNLTVCMAKYDDIWKLIGKKRFVALPLKRLRSIFYCLSSTKPCAHSNQIEIRIQCILYINLTSA